MEPIMVNLFSASKIKILVIATACLISTSALSDELANGKLTKSQVKAAQSALNELGFDAGAVDGSLGKKTRNAYAAFAENNALENDGDFSENEVATLRAFNFNSKNPTDLSRLALPVGGWALDMQKPEVLEQRKVLSRGYSERVRDDRGQLWKSNCTDVLSNTNQISQKIAKGSYDDRGGPLGIHGCLEGIGNIVSYDQDFSPIATVLGFLSNKTYQEYNARDFNGYYNALSVIAVLATHYAVFYDEYDLTTAERKKIDGFLIKNLQIDIDQSRRNYGSVMSNLVPCDHTAFDLFGFGPEQNKASKKWVDNDTCGSLRWKLVNAQAALGLRLNNKILFEMAKYNMQFMLNLFDENNIFVTWASQSGKAINYSKEVPSMLGLQTELYKSAGFDLLEFKGRNGGRVADYQSTYWSLWSENPLFKDTPIYKYAERPLRANEKAVNQIENETLRNLFKDQDTHAPTLARWVKRYALRYYTSIIKHDEPNQFRDGISGHPNNIIGSFNIVDIELLRLANDD